MSSIRVTTIYHYKLGHYDRTGSQILRYMFLFNPAENLRQKHSSTNDMLIKFERLEKTHRCIHTKLFSTVLKYKLSNTRRNAPYAHDIIIPTQTVGVSCKSRLFPKCKSETPKHLAD